MSRRSKLTRKLAAELMRDVDTDILNDIKTVLGAALPQPDDHIGIIMYGIHEQLAQQLPRNYVARLHGNKIEVYIPGNRTLYLTGEVQSLAVSWSSTGGLVNHCLRSFDYSDPCMLPGLLNYVRKRLRAMRKERRKRKNANTDQILNSRRHPR